MTDKPPPAGRGATANPAGRFERLSIEAEPPATDDDGPRPEPTECYRDSSRSVLTRNDSPDVPMEFTINPYRGCEHGCIYCYARPYHEYLGLSAGVDFERKIFVKDQAPVLLRRELMKPSWQPTYIGVSGVTDPYQPVERSFRLTRACLEVLAEFRNPVAVITKNHLVTRDIDVLQALAAHQAAQVFLSITTLDETLARRMEPRASTPQRRLEAVRMLAAAGVPVGVMVAPIIPGLTDHEVPAILAASAGAGAFTAGHNVVRLPHGVKELFVQWLEVHAPDRRQKVVNRLLSVRGGRLNDSTFGSRMTGEGPFAEAIHAMFDLHRRKHGLTASRTLSTAAFRRPPGPQAGLFD